MRTIIVEWTGDRPGTYVLYLVLLSYCTSVLVQDDIAQAYAVAGGRTDSHGRFSTKLLRLCDVHKTVRSFSSNYPLAIDSPSPFCITLLYQSDISVAVPTNLTYADGDEVVAFSYRLPCTPYSYSTAARRSSSHHCSTLTSSQRLILHETVFQEPTRDVPLTPGVS